MQIISRIDAVFVGFYALLIPLVGALLFAVSGQALILPLAASLLAIYLKSALAKPLRRRKAAAGPFPPCWRDFLIARSPFYRGLDDKGRTAFERDILLFLGDNNIVAVGGADVAWQTRLQIGAGVAVMLHGRPGWEPPLPDGITVYPGTSFDVNYQIEKGNIAGQAPERGPLLIAEENLKQDPRRSEPGRDVLVHELAHFFDREKRKTGGGSPLHSRRRRNVPWEDFLTAEWRRHLRHGSVLPSYAALNEAEFFAVACEMFFGNPWPLHDAHPELYDLLRDFFNQDPRQILAGRPSAVANSPAFP